MALTFPLTIPAEYVSVEKLADAYRKGWSHSHGIACHNVPTLGETYHTDGNGKQTADADNIREIHNNLCWQAESNSRQYSPFEYTANAFNQGGESGGWRVCYDHDDRSTEIYETKEAAIEAGRAEGWADVETEEVDVEFFPASESLWEAFETGTAAAIAADLAEYDDDDYGIEEADTEEA